MHCITLISDFGLQDASVAIAKGILMQHAPDATVIDISHEVTPYYLPQAAYLLHASWPSFPRGTVHLVLFDIFSEAVPRLILSAHEGHYFLTPDNGVLPAALGVSPQSWLCLELSGDGSFTHWLHAAARTAANVHATTPGSEYPLPPYQLTPPSAPTPTLTPGELPCDVIHIDHYGNVVTSVTQQQFDAARAGRRFRLQFMLAEEITEVSRHYRDVRPGFRLCRFNSSGHLEICINEGNASRLFGLRPGSRHNDIKIYFE